MASLVKWTKGVQARMFKSTIQFGLEDWNNVTAAEFSSTWTTSTAFSALNNVAYFKDPFNMVRLKGTAIRATPVGNLANEDVLVLPVGYRPYQIVRFPVVTGTNTQIVISAVQINPNGVLEAMPGWTSGWDGAGNTDTDLKRPQDTRLSLDGISFRVAVDG